MRRYFGDHQEALVAYAQAHSLVELVTHTWFGYDVRIYANLCRLMCFRRHLTYEVGCLADLYRHTPHPYRRHKHESRVISHDGRGETLS